MKIKLLIDGGDMKPGPAVAQQLGPMGVNMGKVISDVNSATTVFKGMKVPVELDINEKTKDFTIKTSSPPTSELLKKELNLEKGTDDHKNVKMGNASIEDIIKIAKVKHDGMLEKNLKMAVKSILGTASSVGILVENKNPNELIEQVSNGQFDDIINAGTTETDSDKRKKLDNYFMEIKSEQEAKIAEKKVAEEEAKAKKDEREKKEDSGTKVPAAKPDSKTNEKK